MINDYHEIMIRKMNNERCPIETNKYLSKVSLFSGSSQFSYVANRRTTSRSFQLEFLVICLFVCQCERMFVDPVRPKLRSFFSHIDLSVINLSEFVFIFAFLFFILSILNFKF